jgi:TorA maturation chaperone TorD
MNASGGEADVSRALARAAIYRLLGAAFAYPTPPRLHELAVTAARAHQAGAIGEALAAFAQAATGTDVETAAAEYTLLFDRQAPCVPCEGAYGEAPLMAGKSAALADIAGFYDAFGFGVGGGQWESEDHIIAELEFMSALALMEAWALAGDEPGGLEVTRAAQRTFLEEHLGRWAGAFAAALVTATPLPYYVTAAALLDGWIREDVRALGATPTPLQGRTADDPLQADSFSCPLAEPDA